MEDNTVMEWVVRQPQEFFINAMVLQLSDTWEDVVAMLLATYPTKASAFKLDGQYILYTAPDTTIYSLVHRGKPCLNTVLQLLFWLNVADKTNGIEPTVDEVVTAADCALEDANRHGESFYDIWSAVETFIPYGTRLEAVKNLADKMVENWKHYLKNVVSYRNRVGLGDEE